MAKRNIDFVNMDIDKLCRECSVEELKNVLKALDVEIENRRTDLSKVVGDKYKDILSASDVISNMNVTSNQVLKSIDKIISKCETIVARNPTNDQIANNIIDNKKIEERVALIQILLLLSLKVQTWSWLEKNDCNLAAQLYLLGQHIYTGLKLVREDLLQKLPLIKGIKTDMEVIRNRILKRAKDKFLSIKLESEEASLFLVAVTLLENQNLTGLLNSFLEYRKTALKSIINDSYDTIRAQIIAIVYCLLSSIVIVYDNFLEKESGVIYGLLRLKLEEIVKDSSPYTLTKMELPPTNLIQYIPEIVKKFRPKMSQLKKTDFHNDQLRETLNSWINETSELVKNGLKTKLKFLVNIKSLHFIREEIMKESFPKNWNEICTKIDLKTDFNIWSEYFNEIITNRAEELVTMDITKIVNELEEDVQEILNKNENIKLNLKTWEEEQQQFENEQSRRSLFMKIKGYDKSIMSVCEKLNSNFNEINQEIDLYLQNEKTTTMKDYIKNTCTVNLEKFVHFLKNFLKSETNQSKLLLASRLSEAIVTLCPQLKKCCTVDGNSSLWLNICEQFNQNNLNYLTLWVEAVSNENKTKIDEILNISNIYKMSEILPRWETLEIEGESEETVLVKSEIKVPSRPSIALEQVFNLLSDVLNNVLPYTLPKEIHLLFLEKNIKTILEKYDNLTLSNLNQVQSLQMLLDVKYCSALSVRNDNATLHDLSQKICDKLRSEIDPFDLDVVYSRLLDNVKFSVLQTQIIFGCLLPSSSHLSNFGTAEKKEKERESNIIAFSASSNGNNTTTAWFPLLPVTAPTQKVLASATSRPQKEKNTTKHINRSDKKSTGDVASNMVRSGAAAFFGDWFS